ncbi:conserved hypothetical protein [Burkholderia diffusa]|uniref:hypothetical protein n=1 Tax=Burkholderia diffusa TaxID=488732 RepID=UPI001CB35DC2|nr:hypothetical protein [Burkholderia diffusa]CAG9246195.1 conserved hypothetical protein [Burkholderia diffusa]
MTDQELMKLAASAAQFEIVDSIDPGWFMCNGRQWNPLIDDGDALRMAVRLGINVYLADPGYVTAGRAGIQGQREALGDDPNHATRRAIVRAAASLTDQDRRL